MGISYRKLRNKMKVDGISGYRLQRDCGIANETYESLRKDRYINTKIIERICENMKCQPSDIMEYIPSEKQNPTI